MKANLAKLVSILGHPFLTFSVFSVIALFAYEKFDRALLHSSLILGGICLPLCLKMYWKTKNGSYTNFDVSDRKQRQSWYVSAWVVLSVATIVLYATEQPRPLRLAVLFVLILLSVLKLVNFFLKSSLHVSLNVFLAFLIMTMNLPIGLIFLAIIPFVAWSRLALKRHTVKEIIAGAFIGLVVGVAAFVFS